MFLFPEHQERYEQFLRQDGTHPKDRERQALFYIFAGYKDLGDRIKHFYDFEGRMIRPEAFQAVDLTSGSRALAELAFNLYNNMPCGTVVFAEIKVVDWKNIVADWINKALDCINLEIIHIILATDW